MEKQKEKTPHNFFMIILFCCSLIVIFNSFYFFYQKKDYNFIVEVACDTTKETCFQRDCSNPDDCPPNRLSDFKRYILKANDFQYCKNEDCGEVCETKQIKCEKIECEEDEEMGESCNFVSESSINN